MASRASTGVDKPRKRPRAARACEACRAKKYKCDELYPCSQCKKQRIDCIYEGAEDNKRFRSSSYVANLERQVQELTARLAVGHGSASGSGRPMTNAIQSAPAQIPTSQTAQDGRPPTQYSVSTDENLILGAIGWRHGERLLADDGHVSPPDDHESIHEIGGELRDVNEHTKSIEFHGNTSSMAFLALVQNQTQNQPEATFPNQQFGREKASLVSTLHNIAFSPDSQIPSIAGEVLSEDKNYYFRHSRLFIDAYFDSLHFIHPILEKDEFLTRCEDLWFGRPERQTRSFIALYYSILSLGALIRGWDEKLLDGMDRFQWSRKLFTLAGSTLGELRSMNDLETIQCLMFMAKVCQNELNAHLSYMYLGMAVRASLSAGYHRESDLKRKTNTPAETATAISKTWWGLYSLEVEMSFSLGRPDSLGLEEYHNRRHPPIEDSEIVILPAMIPLARITRSVSIAIYLSTASMREKMILANDIESQMDTWISSLPERIRPGFSREAGSSRILKDPKWARRQRLVLHIRYCNVKMVLYRPFLVYASQSAQRIPMVLEATVTKCVDAARKTIEIMHETFRHHVFFRTWWYNTTYILYAASIILCYATQVAPSSEKPDLFGLVDMTVEIFEAMEECLVAKKAGEMIQQSLSVARQRASAVPTLSDSHRNPSSDHLQPPEAVTEFNINSMLDGQMPLLPMNTIFDFDDPDFSFSMDESQFMFGLP